MALLLAPLLAGFLLSSCTLLEGGPKKGTVGYVEGFLGGVAADAPRAALVGREILAAGGSAADAAVAVYFTLAVVLPGSASLGGGGVCLYQDRESGQTQALDFLPRASATVPESAARPTAVPGSVRGFFALHSRYGRLSWGQLVSPAEGLARFGSPVSRAFARELAAVEAAFMIDSEARRVFGRPGNSGRAVGEGETLVQIDLAATLGRLRIQGPGDFYNGQLARQLVTEARSMGGSLTMEDMRGYKPRWVDTIKLPFGNEVIHFAPPPAAAGTVAAQIWAMLTQGDRYEDAPAEERRHLLAEASMRAYADRGRWMVNGGASTIEPARLVEAGKARSLMANYTADRHLPAAQLRPPPVQRPENAAATGFVVVDREGSAAACTLTLNSPFGTGRVARGLGVLLAAQPGPGGRGAISLVPMLVVNPNVKGLYFAATSTGGVTAPTALMHVAARHLIGGQSLHDAINAKRVHHGGYPDVTYYERNLGASQVQALTRRQHKTATAFRLGQVNAISCPGGLPAKPNTCSALADPRGYGLAATADIQ